MPPKKSSSSSASGDELISASWISGGGDVDLLRRLYETSNYLESLNNNSSSKRNLFSSDFLDEILRRQILRHPNPEVRLVLGCIIAEVLRLSIGPQTSVAASASTATGASSPFPWKSSKETNAEVIQLFVSVLTSTQSTAANLPYRRQILEALSKTHALIPLIRLGKLSEKDQSSFFNGLLMMNTSAGVVIDDSYANYASSALSDLLAASQSISEHQVEAIICALSGNTGSGNVAVSLSEDAAASSTSSGNNSSGSSAAVKKIASSLFRRNDIANDIQSALIPVVAEKFEQLAKDLSDSEAANELTDAQKKQRVRELGNVADRLVDIAVASPSAVSLLLPKLTGLTQDGALQSNDARVVLVKALTRAFLTVPSLAVEYQGSLFTLCNGGLYDVKPAVRAQVVTLISGVLSSHRSFSSSSSSSSSVITNSSNTTSDILWSSLGPQLRALIADTDETVRKTALSSVVDLARLCPDQIPMSLLSEAGNRMYDKKPGVRNLAIEKFAAFYQSFRPKNVEKCAWIPGKIFSTIGSGQHQSGTTANEVDDFVLERVLETLLPNPSRLATDSTSLLDSLLFAEDGAVGKGGKNNNNKKSSASSLFGAGSNNKQQATLFDLGFGGRSGANNNNNKEQQDVKPGNQITFVEGFLTLLEDLDMTNAQNIHNNNVLMSTSGTGNSIITSERLHDALFRLMTKKNKLRQCVALLFDTREQAKRIARDLESDEAKVITDKIRRLINVLRNLTQAPEIAWDTIFKLRDERIIKGLLALTAEDTLDYLSCREEARSRLGTSLKKDVLTFVESNLLPRMAMPLNQTHVSELVHEGSVLRETLYRYYDSPAGKQLLLQQQNAAVSPSSKNSNPPSAVKKGKGKNSGAAPEDSNNNNNQQQNPMEHLERRYRAVIDALHCIELHSPQLLAHHSKDFISWLVTDSERKHRPDTQTTLVRFIQVFTAVNSTVTKSNNSNVFATKKKEIATALGKICLYAGSAQVGIAGADALAQIFPEDGNAVFKQFVPALKSRLSDTVKEQFSKWSEHLCGWLGVFQRLCEIAHGTLGAAGKDLFTAATDIFLVACRSVVGTDPTESMNVKEKIKIVNSVTGVKDIVPVLNGNTSTLSATLVRLSSLAMVAYATGLDNVASRNPAITNTFQKLIEGLKIVTLNDGLISTVSSSLKRIAIYKAMLNICENPPAPNRNNLSESFKIEIHTSTFVSSEANNFVRAEVQRHIADVYASSAKLRENHQLNTRFLSILIMTAVSEEHRATYNFARAQLQSCVHHMQLLGAKTLANNNDDNGGMIPFSDPRSFRVHAEYCVPFLVLYLAHHSFYDSEKEKGNFNAFQRVWHLLFDVILKQSTHSVPFLQESFRKLKGFDDALQPDSPKTREMADLGAKVLQQFLSNRQVGNGTYPGQILLPYCFVSNPKSKFKTESIYLAEEVSVPVQVPFKVAPSVTPSKFGGGGSSSMSLANNNNENDNENNSSNAPSFDIFSSGQRRNRYNKENDDANDNDDDEETTRKPQNSAQQSKKTPLKKKQENHVVEEDNNNDEMKLDQDAASPSPVSKKHKNFPKPPKGMDKVAAGVIKTVCEKCNSKAEILSLKLKALIEEIQEKSGSKATPEIKNHVKEYAGKIVEYFDEMEG